MKATQPARQRVEPVNTAADLLPRRRQNKRVKREDSLTDILFGYAKQEIYLIVLCETCGAPVGEHCMTPTGDRTFWHIARRQSARRAARVMLMLEDLTTLKPASKYPGNQVSPAVLRDLNSRSVDGCFWRNDHPEVLMVHFHNVEGIGECQVWIPWVELETAPWEDVSWIEDEYVLNCWVPKWKEIERLERNLAHLKAFAQGDGVSPVSRWP